MIRNLRMVVCVLGTTLIGCSTDPILTEAEQLQVQKACVEGCAIVPGPIWQKILELLQGVRI